MFLDSPEIVCILLSFMYQNREWGWRADPVDFDIFIGERFPPFPVWEQQKGVALYFWPVSFASLLWIYGKLLFYSQLAEVKQWSVKRVAVLLQLAKSKTAIFPIYIHSKDHPSQM